MRTTVSAQPLQPLPVSSAPHPFSFRRRISIVGFLPTQWRLLSPHLLPFLPALRPSAIRQVFAWSQQQAWFRPNMRLYNALMGFLAREQQAHAATLLFQDMLLSRARPNHFTYTALINAYGRAGWFEDALAVFHHMKTCDDDDCRPNTVTCNALIGALCKGGMYDEAVEVFMDMRAGAGGAGGLPLNCRPNIVTYNTLIDTLCREGQLDAALQVGMPLCRWVCRSAGGYAALQVGMPHDHGLLVWIRFAGVDTVLEEDLSSGVLDSQVAPNIVTFNTIINIVLEDLSSGVLDSQVLEDLSSGVLDSQVAPNIVTFNTIINACGKAFETSQKSIPHPTRPAGAGGPLIRRAGLPGVLDSQVAPNIITFNTIINACGKAFETSQKSIPHPTRPAGAGGPIIRRAGLPGVLDSQVLEDLSSGVLDSQVAPNIVTFNTIINACGKAGRAPDAEATLHAMERTGMPPDGITFTALVDAYGRTGDVERAEEAFQRMLQAGISPDVFSYTALMAAFGRAGLSDRVTETLAAMQRAGVPPNEVTFLTVLDAHGKAGNYEEAEATLAVMVTCGYRPSVYSWSCLIDAFGKAGLYAKAAGAFERMQAEGCRPNLITYAAILSACARCDKWEGALELLYCLQRTGGEWEVAMCRLVMAGPEEEGVECASEEEMLEGLVRGGARGGAGRRGERADEGLWESAGRMFGAFQAVPLPMRRSFYNALADVLWSFGMRRRAARVVALGRGLGVYGGADDLHKEARGARRVGAGRRESSSSGSESESGSGSGSGSGKQRGGGGGSGRGGGMWREEGVWSVDLHEHSIGSACAFLYLWLRDLRTAWQWHNEIPEAIDIVTGWGRHSKRKDATSDKPAQVAPLKAAILRELHLMRSPFQELSVNAGRLVAGGWAAYSWLLQEEMGEQLQLRDAPQPVPPGDKPYQPL
ncbi:unnamed protein product [Closterium sp. NIES-65]|nr:unnamed protein product [Closterium sp. NIES-65]